MSKKKQSDNTGGENALLEESGSENQLGENANTPEEKETTKKESGDDSEKQPEKPEIDIVEKETAPPVKPQEIESEVDLPDVLCRVLRHTYTGGDQLRPDDLIAAPKAVVDKLVEDGAVDDSESAVNYCESRGIEPRKIGEKRQPKKPAAGSDAVIAD